jgi:DNA-binding beta-propeller fold protein YncE
MPAYLRYLTALLILSLSPLAVSATLLVVNKSGASVSLHDLPDGRELLRLSTGEAPHEVAVSPDGTTAVVTNYGTRKSAGRSSTVADISRAGNE